MTSMRKLRRRLLRWTRYDHRFTSNAWFPNSYKMPPGLTRAAKAVAVEEKRRETVDVPDDGCCTLDPGHDGPCVWFCSWCSGDGRCPDCGGFDDLGCEECGGSLSCPYCDGGEIVEDVYVGPRIETTHAFTQLGLL